MDNPYIFDFGKYEGMTLYEVIKIDRPYLEWLICQDAIKIYKVDLFYLMLKCGVIYKDVYDNMKHV